MTTLTVDEALAQAAGRWSAGGDDNRAAAKQIVQQVLRVAPDHPGALNLAGCSAFEEGNPGVALALFEKAIAGAPGDLAVQGNLARSEFMVGRVESARRRADYLATVSHPSAGIVREFENHLARSRREPAVAGTFFTANAGTLAQEVDGYIATGTPDARQPKLIVAPHAGHIYSGATAGKAYARVKPFAGAIRRVVLLGPAHRVHVRGVALSGAGSWVSPLGVVPIDTLGADAIADLPFVSTRADVHAQEHSLEVHLPFLQRSLGAFELLPLVVGDVAPGEVAKVLDRLWGGEDTLIVISTDLSHYHPYDEANAIDAASCERVMALDPSLHHDQACGATPLNAALGLIAKRGLTLEQIDRCNSGDTAGDRERVVGYASFAAYESASSAGATQPLTEEQGLALVQLARASLHEATGAPREPMPGTKSFQDAGASFVTLTKNGALRGCIGSLEAHRPLAEDVRANAAAAALSDPRFPPVAGDEAEGLDVEVSVLTPAVPLPHANESHALWQLQPGRDGVIFECMREGRRYRSTYLPQVWEQIPSPRAFIASLKAKAGLPFDFWAADVRLSTYRVAKFSESE